MALIVKVCPAPVPMAMFVPAKAPSVVLRVLTEARAGVTAATLKFTPLVTTQLASHVLN